MKNRIKILLIAIIGSIGLISTSFFIPYSFTAIHDGLSADFWLFISHTGGTYGVPFITLLFCIIISFQYKGWIRKSLSITLSLLTFSIILGGLAQLNEFFIKEKLQVERPNIKYLESQQLLDADEFYRQPSKDARRVYLKNHLQEHNITTIYFDDEPLHPDVMEHWMHATGYSFPSGHSVNAFLMATLMGYILLFMYADFRRRMLFLLPFIWALLVAASRVMLGVHSPTDVTFGATWGCLCGLLIIVTGLADKNLKQKILY